MLTDVQKGMVKYWVTECISQLILYFTRFHRINNPYREVAQIIINAINNNYTGAYTVSSEQLSWGAEKVEVMKQELNGVFNPDFAVLNALHIINNPRDIVNGEKIEVTSEGLRYFADEISTEARISIDRLAYRVPQLSRFLEEISITGPSCPDSMTGSPPKP